MTIFFAAFYATLFIIVVFRMFGEEKKRRDVQLYTRRIPVEIDQGIVDAGVFAPRISRFEKIEEGKL